MVSGENPIRRRKYSSGQRFYRLLRLRLIIPMFRARQPAENTARAVAVGLFWAFTPTFGIQMGLTFIHWYCSRTFLKKDFNVVVAMAWTWVTNVFTVPICYYLFAKFQLFLLFILTSSRPSYAITWSFYSFRCKHKH